MKRYLLLAGMLLTSVLVLAAQPPAATPTPAATPRPTPAPLALKVGDEAPDFTLPSTAGQKVKLSDFRGKSNVVLAFYVLAFTGG